MMWRETESQIEHELGDGERLLWSGKPRQGIVFRSFDVFVIPFSLMWSGFVVFAVVNALSSDSPPFLVLWLIPFVLAGLYILFGRFIVDAMRRERTAYGVTDQRVIIISGYFSRRVQSLNLGTLSDLSLSEKRNRSGTITFGPSHPMSSMWGYGWPSWAGAGHSTSMFETIEDAREVYDLIRRAQQAS